MLVYPSLQLVNTQTKSARFNRDGLIVTRRNMLEFASTYMFGGWQHLNTLDANNHTSAAFKQWYFKQYFDPSSLPNDDIQTQTDAVSLETGDDDFYEMHKSMMKDPYLHPLLASDVSGLPPAVILSCHYDVLRDDSFFFAARLKRVGVPVQHVDLKCIHGWLSAISVVPQFEKFFIDMLVHIKDFL